MAGKVRLLFLAVSEIVGSDGLAILLMTDVTRSRQLAIVCDRHMEHEFGSRLMQAQLASRRLPEVLCSLMPDMDSQHYELYIHDIYDGQYKAAVLNRQTLDMTPIRVSDGVLLAYVAQLEIYMDEALFMRQSAPTKGDNRGMPIPINVLSDDMLQQALAKLVEDEQYELASVLRDEINKRKQKGGQA